MNCVNWLLHRRGRCISGTRPGTGLRPRVREPLLKGERELRGHELNPDSPGTWVIREPGRTAIWAVVTYPRRHARGFEPRGRRRQVLGPESKVAQAERVGRPGPARAFFDELDVGRAVHRVTHDQLGRPDHAIYPHLDGGLAQRGEPQAE